MKRSDNLRASLVAQAESDAHFMASAIAAWQQARPQIAPHDLLRCRAEDLWRVALASRPKSSDEFPLAVKRIANAFAIDPEGLISLLRLADSLGVLRGSYPESRELLVAARDRRKHGSDERTGPNIPANSDEPDQS
jgi:hypothetical protein